MIVFSILRPVFFTAGNFANLLTQGAAITVIAMGLVFVLLLGEIDLSAGFTSGVCAAVLATAAHRLGLVVARSAVAAALLVGLLIGTTMGTLVARVGIPSFVVTLAAFLAFQGTVLLIIGEGGNVAIRDETILAIENKNLPPLLGLGPVGGVDRRLRRGRSCCAPSAAGPSGLAAEPMAVLAAKVGGLAAAHRHRGLRAQPGAQPQRPGDLPQGRPMVVPIILVLLVVLHASCSGAPPTAATSTRSAATPRRPGGPASRSTSIRTSVFMVCSTMAAIGGIIAASRANSVDPNTGGSNILLYAVGAAVIGGTSLFGGKGKVLDAIIGGAVIAVIDNGMGLLGYSAGIKFIVTGLVLLIAASVDALSRKRAHATGRA